MCFDSRRRLTSLTSCSVCRRAETVVSFSYSKSANSDTQTSPLASIYKKLGLKMLDEHATHAAGGMGVEAGITEMLERMQTARFKVFRGQEQWLEEFRYYHREDGLIVKERDDLISSTRYALMMRRFAKQPPSMEERHVPTPRHSNWAI
jgi:hypothetical protein